MDYSGWVTTCCNLLEYTAVDATSATPTGVPSFDSSISACLDYTENALQRDLDFLATTVSATGVMTPNSRVLTLPSVNLLTAGMIPLFLGAPVPPGSIVTTINGQEQFNLEWEAHDKAVGEQVSFLQPLVVGGITIGGVYTIIAVPDADDLTLIANYPATASASGTVVGTGLYIVATRISPVVAGVRQQSLEPITRDAMDFFWPSDTSPGANILPVQWAPFDQATVLVGPAPDQAYGFEVIGTMRFPRLSYINTQNFLTVNVPDLYVAKSMEWWGLFQRDAELSAAWAAEYKSLLGGAAVEETRKRYANIFPSPSNPAGGPG